MVLKMLVLAVFLAVASVTFWLLLAVASATPAQSPTAPAVIREESSSRYGERVPFEEMTCRDYQGCSAR